MIKFDIIKVKGRINLVYNYKPPFKLIKTELYTLHTISYFLKKIQILLNSTEMLFFINKYLKAKQKITGDQEYKDTWRSRI